MKRCEYTPCGELFEPKRQNQRFHSDTCRARWHQENRAAPGTVKRVGQIKGGVWSITVHYPHQPNVHNGQKVALTTGDENARKKRTNAK